MIKITKEDYTEMEVMTMNGEWVKKDVLKTLVGGGAIYLEGTKGLDGVYSMGMVVPAMAYREIVKKVMVRKPLKECLQLLIDNGYLPNDTGDYVNAEGDTIDADDLVIPYLEYLPEWLKEEETPVEKTEMEDNQSENSPCIFE